MQMTEDGKVAYRCTVEVYPMNVGDQWSFQVYSIDSDHEATFVGDGHGYPSEQSAKDAGTTLARHYERVWEEAVSLNNLNNQTRELIVGLDSVAYSPELYEKMQRKIYEWQNVPMDSVGESLGAALGRPTSARRTIAIMQADERGGTYNESLPKELRKHADDGY